MEIGAPVGSVSGDSDRAVIVAVIAIQMMEMTVNEMVNVVAVRDGIMTAVRAVDVIGGVFGSGEARRAFVRISGADGEGVFVHMGAVHVMQMACIKVVGVTVVRDGEMAATGAVLMRMAFRVFGMSRAGGDNERDGDE